MSETEATPVAKKNNSWIIQWIIGIFLTGGFIFVLSRIVSWEEMKTALASIKPATFALLFGIYLVSMLARAWGWQILLERRVSLWRAMLGLNEGYLLNNILPLRLGEIGRAFLIGRRTGRGTLSTLSTVVVERAYDLAIAAGLLLSTLPFALKMDWARPAALVLLLIVIGALVFLYFAAHNRVRLEAWLVKKLGHIGLFNRFLLPMGHSLLEGFAVLTRFEYFALSLFALLLSWGTALIRDYIILQNLAPGAPLWWAMLTMSVANLGGALPSMMASLGTFEGAATGAMVLIGAKPEVGLVYAIIVHVIHLVSSSIIGLIGIMQEGQSLSKIISDLRSIR